MARNGRRVTVAGGGVGGLATALLLARAGAEVTVVERVREPAAVGAAIALYPNGLAVLYGLGLRTPLSEHAFTARRGAITLNGRTLLDVTLPDFGHGIDHALAIRRSRLYDVLYDAVRAEPNVDPRFGDEVTGAAADGTLDVRGAGGRRYTLRSDLVVGADGVRSTVRAAADLGARLSGTPSIALRALVPGEEFGRTTVGEHWSRHGIAIAAPLGDGSAYLALAASRGPLKTALAGGDLGAVRRIAAGMVPGAERALRAVPDDELLVTPIQQVRCARWHTGRLVLLGDAAHAMTPHLGQGANSALLDAATLAEELTRDQPHERALARYVARRRPAATRVQRGSRMHALVSEQLTVRGGRQLRDATIRLLARLPDSEEQFLRATLQEDPARVFTRVRELTGAGA